MLLFHMYFAGDDCKIDMYYVVGRRIKVWVLCWVDEALYLMEGGV